jgi:tetratricopeptide (TPR) repeat protein
MRRLIDLILVTIAASLLLLIVARWLLPAIGLPGVDYETAHTVVKLASYLMFFVIMSLATPWLYQRHRDFKRRNPKISFADGGWEDFFLGRKADSEQTTLQPFEIKLIESTAVEKDAVEKETDTKEAEVSEETEEIAPHFDGRSFSEIQLGKSNGTQASDIVITAEDGTAHLNAVKQPFSQLPPHLPEFTGRTAELEKLTAAQANPDHKILCIQGSGGVGKTTLAVKLAHDLSGHYPDAQIFIDLKGARVQPLQPSQALSQIIRAFMPTARLPEKEDELTQIYRSLLEGKRVLLLFDNAANSDQITPLLPPAGSLPIITSRTKIELPAMHITQLGGLNGQEARDLLHRIVPRLGDHAERIAELCSRLPLAMRIAASTMTLHPELSFDEFAKRLEVLRSENAGEPIEAVLQGTYRLLDQGLQRLWRVLSIFPDSFDINAAASVWRINPGRAADALDYLMFYSLIDRNRTTGRFRLHDLMLTFTEQALTAEERPIASYLHSAHYQSVLHEAEALYEQGGQALKQGLALLDLEWQNIQTGQAWAVVNYDQNRAACELCATYPVAGKYVRGLRQHPRERIRWSEAALNAAKLLQRRKAMGRHLIALGDSYVDLSDPDNAIDCYVQALDLAREISDHRGESDALSGLGMAHYLSGRMVQAAEFHESALEIGRLIKDQRAEAIALGNLGMTHYAQGDAQKAEALFDQQLIIARETGDRHNESLALGGLGMVHNTLGNPEKAITLLNQQLTISRDIGDRRGELSALSQLGSAYASLKNNPHAVAYHEQALVVAREIGDRRNETNALGGLGAHYYLRGNLEVALQYFEQQLSVATEAGDRRSKSLAQLSLGEAYIVRGNAKRAIELLQQAFGLTSEMGDIRGQSKSLYQLALALDKYGDRRQAVAQARTALELFEAAQDPLAELVRKQLAEWG